VQRLTQSLLFGVETALTTLQEVSIPPYHNQADRYSFGAHIREVELHLISTPWILAQPSLISVLQHVKRYEIKVFRLKFVGQYVNWNHLSADFRFAIQDLFALPSLATLHLEFIHSLPPDILPTCITMQELYLKKAFFYESNLPKERLRGAHNCSRLQSLSIANSGASLKFIVDAILQTTESEVSRLRKLDIEGSDDIYSLQRLLSYASARLEYLHLKHTRGTVIPESLGGLISGCLSLQHLHIELPLFETASLYDTLRRFPLANNLRTIDFSFDSSSSDVDFFMTDMEDQENFKNLDTLLLSFGENASLRFVALSITIKGPTDDTSTTLTRIVTETFGKISRSPAIDFSHSIHLLPLY